MGSSLMTDLYRIVHLFRQFPRYDKLTYEDIVKKITPSLNLDQYQIHRVNGQDVGFTNWAYLSDTVEERFKLTGKLKPNEWNSGDNIWHIETVAKSHLREIMSWTKEYFRNKLNVNQPIKWLRVKDNNIIYRRSQKFKREFHI
jgi:hemolysin-activating ACP:hemolysin acyltransferase